MSCISQAGVPSPLTKFLLLPLARWGTYLISHLEQLCLFPLAHNHKTKSPLLAFTPAFSMTQEGHCLCLWRKL